MSRSYLASVTLLLKDNISNADIDKIKWKGNGPTEIQRASNDDSDHEKMYHEEMLQEVQGVKIVDDEYDEKISGNEKQESIQLLQRRMSHVKYNLFAEKSPNNTFW